MEVALDHHDGKHLTGQVDHRSVRMIQRPFLSLDSLANRQNLTELLRRAAYRFKTHNNLKNLLAVSPEQYRHYFKFAIVRNPWARSYSWYKNVVRGTVNKKQLGVTSDISLNEFLRKFLLKGALRPQVHWLRDFRGSIPLDFVGCVEHLEADFTIVCEHLGLAKPELERIRDGETADYQDHFDAESIQLVAQAYAEEISLFGYSFERREPSRHPIDISSTTS